MKKMLSTGGIGIAALLSWWFFCSANDAKFYLVDKDGQKELKETLVLREEQSGIGGRQIWTWVVRPSGAWLYVQLTYDSEGKEIADTRQEKSGTLTQEQVIALGQELLAQNMIHWPVALGVEAKINPHRYLLRFGDRQTLVDGALPRREGSVHENILQSMPAEEKNPAAWTRFARIAQAICEACREE